MPRSPSRKTPNKFLGSALAVLVIALAYSIYHTVTSNGQLAWVAVPLPADKTPASPGWYSLYFSEPEAPSALSYQGGPDQALAAAVDGAHLSVDVAAYEIDLYGLRRALIDANRRGVAVRIVTESDNREQPVMQALVAAGIPVVDDRRPGLMHDKFIVIDRLEVWTGSMNYTVNGAYRNDNNLIRIRSSRLAEDYTGEFEEMFVEKRFGEGSPAGPPVPTLSVDGGLLEVYFAPEDGTAGRLIELIGEAQQSIYFLAYAFTADDIAAAMLERAHSGVTVSGVFEASQAGSGSGSEYDRLRSAGLDVRKDGSPGAMHHKVLILDGQVVVTGSYNFSASAQNRNDENTLVIHDPEIAAQFLGEFERIFRRAIP